MKKNTTIILGLLAFAGNVHAEQTKAEAPVVSSVKIPEAILTAVTKADIDKSGGLSLAEFGPMIRKNTIRHMEKYKLEGEALDTKIASVEASKFKGIDSNKDGSISAAEYAVSRAQAAERKAKRKKEEEAKATPSH